jgi:hypothetical protein
VSIELRTLLRGAGGLACAASTVVAVAAFGGAFSTYAPAAAHQSSDPGTDNRGDVWVDVTGSNDGPEMDPHLGCPPSIAIWGMKLNDSSGPFTIQGWPPSGSGASDIDFSGTWTFDPSSDTQQVIATVDTQTLLSNAMANGDTAQPQQGFHFKLDVEDPRTKSSIGDDKYKVFWVNCAGGVGGETSPPSPPGSPPASPPASPPSSPPASPPSSPPSSPPASPPASPSGGVLGSTTTTTSSMSTTSSPTGGVGAAITPPNTGGGPGNGGELPLGLSAGLMALGLSLLGVGRRMRPRSTT